MSPASPPSRGTKARAARLDPPAGGRAATEPRGRSAPRGESSSAAPTTTWPGPEGTERELGADELAALEEQRRFLLASLRDLEAEHDAGDVDEADYEALKDDYTARAAAVIRAVDGHRALVAARRPPVSWGRRLAIVGAVVLVAVGCGVFVARSAGQRTAGDTISGGSRQSTRDLLLEARQSQQPGQYDEAIKLYDQVLEVDPGNVEALSYRGWMFRLKAMSAAGDDPVPSLQEAIKSLTSAVKAKPDDGTALVFLAVLYGDLQQPQSALDTLDRVPAGGVPAFMADTITGFRQRMEAELTSNPSTTTTATTS